MADFQFGYEIVNTINVGSSDRIYSTGFTAPSDATITEIRVNLDSSANIKAGLATFNGSTFTLLNADNTGISGSAGWNTLTIPDTAVTGGNTYYICVIVDATAVLTREGTSGSGITAVYNTTYAAGIPSSWPDTLGDTSELNFAAYGTSASEVAGGTFSLVGGSVGTTQYQQLTGGTFSLTGGAVETDYDTLTGGTFSLAGGSVVSSRLYVPPSGTFSLTGGSVGTTQYQQLTGGTFSLTGGSVVNSRLHVPPSGVFSFAGGSVATARLQVAGGGVFSFAGGSLPDSLQTTVALYRDVLDNAYAIYACNTFGNDTDGNYIWERLDSTKDLILGDGSTASTFPTFTTTADKHTEYYAFDGVDDYVSNWPTAGFVSAALSSSYPGGQPYVTQVTDDTVKDLLTVGGAFTGNLHSLVFFSSEPTEEDKWKLADYQLRRLWRDTIIDPYTARLIRNGEAVQVYDFQVLLTSVYTDYALGALAAPTGITWDNGLTFDTGTSVVTVPDEPALRMPSAVTVFAAGGMADGYIVEKGSNYSLSAAVSGSDLTLTANSVAAASPAESSAQSVAVTLSAGNAPRFYVDGEYHDSGATPITMPTGSDNLLIGNTSGGGSEFEGTLRRLRIFNRVLTDAEIRLMHYGAVLGDSET